MTDIDYFQVIKWVLIVLAAGFIGQFGKTMATYLIRKVKGTKTSDRPEPAATTFVEGPRDTAPAPPISERRDLEDKAGKKASKALTKMKKKENK